MNKKYKAYIKLNIMSLFFIVVSFISVTLAWFAYSGIARVDTEVGVKAWYIEFEKDNQTISSDIVINLDDIYPGMETVNEVVDVKNLGDSDAQLEYSIVSARILGDSADNYVVSDNLTSEQVEDYIAHNYPFHININLSKNFVRAIDDSSVFEVSVSWPLDSDTDSFDSKWGSDAYKFQQDEESKKAADPNYQIQSSVKIVISVTAEQYIETPEATDMNFSLGDLILYDVVSNRSCDKISTTCLKTHVIDIHNKLGDTTVTLLPDLYSEYTTGIYTDYDTLFATAISGWTVETRPLLVNDLLQVVSNDVLNSVLVRNNISDSIIGYLKYGTRINTELSKAINYNGYYRFNNLSFTYLMTSKCYWTNSSYNSNQSFALVKENDDTSKIFGENNTSICSVVPVIIAPKVNIVY